LHHDTVTADNESAATFDDSAEVEDIGDEIDDIRNTI
jgi:hypothetical protein